MSNKDIEEDVKELNRLYDIAEVVLPKYSTAKIVYRISEKQRIAIKNILADRQRYKNMYEAEHRIHLVRNEQLARKERAVLKANKYDNLISEIKSEIEAIKDKRSKLGFKTYLKREDMIREDSILLGEQKVLQKLLKTIEGEKK